MKTQLLALCAVALALHAPADTLYMTAGTGLYRIDNYESPASPLVFVGNTTAFNDIAIDPATGQAWGVAFLSSPLGFRNELFSLDLTSGTALPLGFIGPTQNHDWSALTYANGVLYAGADDVYSIDPATLQTTLLFTGTSQISGDLAYNPFDGYLYSANQNNGNSTLILQRYNLSNNSQTTVGIFNGSPLVGYFSGGAFWGLDFDSTGLLFGATSGGNLLEINPTDASVSLVSSYVISPGGMASMPEPTPEPSSALLSAVGAFIMVGRCCLVSRRRNDCHAKVDRSSLP